VRTVKVNLWYGCCWWVPTKIPKFWVDEDSDRSVSSFFGWSAGDQGYDGYTY
jgi:hypothetical protein